MGGSHFCLTETELRALLLFYAPIMTPGQLWRPKRPFVKCQRVGLKCNPPPSR